LCLEFGDGVGFFKEKFMTTSNITRKQVPEHKRLSHTAKLFGLNFPLQLEPLVYAITDNIANDYHGGYWEFYELSNGGFYMAPHSDTPIQCQLQKWL
jgi:hypothetical protein